MSSDWFPQAVVDSVHDRGTALRRYAILVPLALVLCSEALLFVGRTRYALWGHLVALLVSVLAPLRLREDVPTFAAFVPVPIFRLVTFGIPAVSGATLPRLLVVYGAMVPAVYLVGSARNRAVSLGTKTAVLALPVALPMSALLAGVEYRILRPAALIPTWNIARVAFAGVVLVVLVGFVEELLFRGILQRALEDRLGRWPGLALASVVSGMMYSVYGVPGELVYAVGVGFVFGLVYDRTESLALVALVHGLVNLFLFVVIPLRGPFLAV